MVHEQVLARVVRRDEAEALVVAEPLDGSGGHRCSLLVQVHCETRRCWEATTAETLGTASVRRTPDPSPEPSAPRVPGTGRADRGSRRSLGAPSPRTGGGRPLQAKTVPRHPERTGGSRSYQGHARDVPPIAPGLVAGVAVLLLAPATGLAAGQVDLSPAAGAPGSTAVLRASGFPASKRIKVSAPGLRPRSVKTSRTRRLHAAAHDAQALGLGHDHLARRRPPGRQPLLRHVAPRRLAGRGARRRRRRAPAPLADDAVPGQHAARPGHRLRPPPHAAALRLRSRAARPDGPDRGLHGGAAPSRGPQPPARGPFPHRRRPAPGRPDDRQRPRDVVGQRRQNPPEKPHEPPTEPPPAVVAPASHRARPRSPARPRSGRR